MDTAAQVAESAAALRTAAASFTGVFGGASEQQNANHESGLHQEISKAQQQQSSSIQASSTAVSVSEYKECANCGVNDTPLWRKYNDHDLCNACGIYFRVNGFHRPFLPNMRKLLSSARKMGLSCVNCSTKITSMWRRTPEGESICNACGLYYRLNGVKRPVTMRKDWIRKRQRKTQQISGIMRLANQSILSTSVVEQQQLESVNSQSGVSQQQTPPLSSQPASFDSNHHHQLNQLNQSNQCFPLVNGSVHDPCQSELVHQQQQSSQNEDHYHQQQQHQQKTFDSYSLQYYDFGGQTVTFQQQQQPIQDHHTSHELQPMINSGQSYMHQIHSYSEVPVECTANGVYSSSSYHSQHEDIKAVHHHHQQQHNGHHHQHH